MSRRSVLLAVLAWAAVVAVASGVTWWVIDAAGQQVLSGGDLPAQVQRSSASVAPTPGTPPTRPPAPKPSHQRTWEGPTGSVTVRCQGGRVSLQSASPGDGYRVDVGTRGPAEVEVTFRGEERAVSVRGTCPGGSPRFATESPAATGGDD